MMKNESLNTKICAKQDARKLNCRKQLLGEPSLFRIRDQVIYLLIYRGFYMLSCRTVGVENRW